jgi:hypothetical protein
MEETGSTEPTGSRAEFDGSSLDLFIVRREILPGPRRQRQQTDRSFDSAQPGISNGSSNIQIRRA